MRPFRPTSLFIAVLLVAVGAGGCASSHSSQESPAAQAAAIGTWKYEVEGFAPLYAGTFRITAKDGRLQGLVQDRRRGRLRARVDLHDSHMELLVDDIRISGYVEDGTFRGFLRRQAWSVVSRQSHRRRDRTRSATLYARRVRSGVAVDKPSVLECRSILRETDGCS